MPALEGIALERVAGGDRRQDALGKIEALLKMNTRMHQDAPGHPQVVECVGRGLPAPPPFLPAASRVEEVGVPERTARADIVLDGLDHALVLAQPAGPAGV